MSYRPTLWDRLATGGDPEAMERRVRARARIESTARTLDAIDERAEQRGLKVPGSTRFESGSGGHRWFPWRRSNASINVHINNGLRETQSRSRKLHRDTPWGKRVRQAIVSHTVGHGITAEIKANVGASVTARDLEKINAAYQKWFETTVCDANGILDGYGLQALALGSTVTDGEVFVRARWRRKRDGLPVPLQLQLVTTDLIDFAKTMLLQNGRIVQGVEFDSLGRRVAYWMFRENPQDILRRDTQSYRVPASEVAHMFWIDEPGQVHGMPWSHAVMLSAKDFDQFEDAFLRRQALANGWVAAVHDMDGQSLMAKINPDGSEASESDGAAFETESGTIIELPRGKKATFSDPPKPDGYEDFTRHFNLRFATAHGMSYMSVTGDLRQVSFISGRMGKIDQNKNIDQWRWLMMVPRMLDHIGAWFLEAYRLQTGMDTSGLYFEYSPPPHEMTDPANEVPANIKAIRGGLNTLPAYHRSQGMRTAAVLNEVAELNASLDRLQITLDTDPRKVSQQGQEQKGQQNAE